MSVALVSCAFRYQPKEVSVPTPRQTTLNKKCTNCGLEFKAKRRTKKYCTDSCRANAAKLRAQSTQVRCIGYLTKPCPDKLTTTSKEKRCKNCKPKHNRFKSFPNSSFGRQVIHTIKRAGTIETFPNVEAIKDYAQLCKARAGFCSIELGVHKREFEVCHKVPVGHSDVMGLTTGNNLFIGTSKLNRKAGNRDWGYHAHNDSLYILRKDLKKDCCVNKDSTAAEIMELLLKCFGTDFLTYLVEANHTVRNPREETDDDLCISGSYPAAVLALEVCRIYGDSDPELASTLIDWANYVEGHHSDAHRECWKELGDGGNLIRNSDRWEEIQYVLQTNIAFDCDPFIIGYELIDPDDGW